MNKTLEDIKSEVHLMLQDLTHDELKDYFSYLIYDYDKLQQRINKAIEKVDILRKAYKKNICSIPCTEIEEIDKVLKGDNNDR